MDSLGNEKTMMPGEGGRKAGLAPGDVLGQYRVLRLLGKGGMGEVHLVEHSILTTRHALKLLPEERSASEAFLQRFHDEARVMAKLRHPGIVHVTHADAAKDRHYLIMDFVGADGGEEPFDLEEALAGAPDNRLPAPVVARLGAQICAAVEAAHKAGVIHRDLKPANVLLTSRELEKAEARVTDFGLARLLGEEWVKSLVDVSMRRSLSIGGMPTMAKPRSERSSTGAILGTYEYMSPEQREGREVDERSDIFALGVMLYRMVTGKRLVGRAKAASRIVEDLDGDWDELIDACLEEDPDDRPESMADVGERLSKLESAEKEKRSKRAREEAERREKLREEREEEARLAAEREEIQRIREEKKRREEHARQKRMEEEREEQRKREETAKRPEPETGAAAAKDRRGKMSSGAKRLMQWTIGLIMIIGLAVFVKNALLEAPPSRRAQRSAIPSLNPEPARTVAPSKRSPTPSPATKTAPVEGEDWPADLGGGVRMVFKAIPAGTFQMGSNNGAYDEKPVHTVRLTRPFWMGEHEVTNGQYEQFLKESGYDGRRDADGDYLRHHRDWSEYASKSGNYPIVAVSWKNAQKFCEWLTRRAHEQGSLPREYSYRLPTEAEWEYACRAGTTGDYAGGLDAMAWYSGNSGGKTHEVGRRQPNRTTAMPIAGGQ